METARWGMRRAGDGTRAWMSPDWDGGLCFGPALGSLRDCWSVVGLVQAADVPGRVDLGAGTLDWPGILRWVRDRGYRGLIEIEHLPLEDSAAGEQRLLERLTVVDAAI